MASDTKLKYYQGFLSFLPTLVFIWVAIAIYRYNPFYSKFLREEVQIMLLDMAILYSIFGLLWMLLSPDKNRTDGHATILWKILKRTSLEWVKYLRTFTQNHELRPPTIEKHEKVSLLFLLVKFYFLPLMLSSAFNYMSSMRHILVTTDALPNFFSYHDFLNTIFPFLIAVLFFVDTAYFAFGYTVESKLLKNEIRSVEPTVLGWAVALICYSPFNTILRDFVPWVTPSQLDLPRLESASFTVGMHIIILLFLSIYVWSSIALGAKCSNLTNRGIVSRGPYRFVRHPAYIAKNIAWWIALVPIMTIPSFFAMLSWSFVYFLRSITEERHLLHDPEYRAYCQKVRHRFIPGLY